MNRITLLLAAMFWSAHFYSQDYPEASAPDIFPASPESASLGKYGNVQAALHTGNMIFSVPIHTIQMGAYSWPIALNYSYGGLLLEGKQSIVGLGWGLSGTGAVTREVRGLPDGHPEGYYGPHNRGARIKDYMENNNDFSLAEFRKYLYGEWDKEVDIYHMRAGGVSFSFKLDENGNPVYLSQHNHQVTYADQEITVTDDNGIIYVFSDLENNVPSDATPGSWYEYTITWNLSQVIYPTGKSISFVYEGDQYLSYDFYAIGTNSYFPNGLEDGTANGNTGPTYGVGSYTDGVNQTVVNRKILKTINTSNMESIEFAIGERSGRKIYTGIAVARKQHINAYAFSYEGDRDVLTQITKNGQLVYGFDYHDPNGVPAFMNSLTDKPLSQDDWRFYNASGNQFALNIPSSQYVANKKPNFLATRKGAMKRITYPTGGYSIVEYEQNSVKELYDGEAVNNANVAFNRQIQLKLQSDNDSSGPLIKTSQFTYTFTQPTIATIASIMRGTLNRSHMEMSISRADACPGTIDEATGEVIIYNPVSDDYYVNAPHFRAVSGKDAPEMCPTLGDGFGPDEADPGYYSFYHDSGGRIIIKPGTYTFTITNDYNRSSDAYGEIRVRFYESNQSNQNPSVSHINVEVGGIRVRKIQHFSENDAIANTQYFNYNDDDNFSSGILLNKTHVVPFNKVTFSDSPTTSSVPFRNEVTDFVYPLNRFNSLNVDQSAPVFYKTVKEFGDFVFVSTDVDDTDNSDHPIFEPFTNDDGSLVFSEIGGLETDIDNGILVFPNGYKLTEFEVPAQNYDFVHPKYPEAQDLSKGRVKSVSIFRNEDNVASLVEKSETTHQLFRGLLDQNYQDYNVNHPWSLRMAQKLNVISDCTIPGACDQDPIPSQEHYVISRYIVQPYKELNKSYKPQSSVRTSFYDEDGVQKIVSTTTTNSYNDYYALSESETEDSNGEIIKSIYKYPYDNMGDFDDLSPNASEAVGILNAKNRIASPLQTETYKRVGNVETPLFVQRMDYKSRSDNDLNVTLLLPEKTLISKSNNVLEERLIYHKYDAYGNPLEVSLTGGSHTYYIWGYDKQFPIAKISNFTSEQAGNVKALIDLAITTSDADNDRTMGTQGTEGALRTALENIRLHGELQKAQMTYSTYDPLVGVTSVTDSKGYTVYYEYDDLNRLEFVRDEEGKLISENKYNYKN